MNETTNRIPLMRVNARDKDLNSLLKKKQPKAGKRGGKESKNVIPTLPSKQKKFLIKKQQRER